MIIDYLDTTYIIYDTMRVVVTSNWITLFMDSRSGSGAGSSCVKTTVGVFAMQLPLTALSMLQ